MDILFVDILFGEICNPLSSFRPYLYHHRAVPVKSPKGYERVVAILGIMTWSPHIPFSSPFQRVVIRIIGGVAVLTKQSSEPRTLEYGHTVMTSKVTTFLAMMKSIFQVVLIEISASKVAEAVEVRATSLLCSKNREGDEGFIWKFRSDRFQNFMSFIA